MEITPEMIDYCTNTPPAQEITEPAGVYPRPVKQVWDTERGMITKIIEYIYPGDSDENGLVLNETWT
jgi:hypothetical protein